MPNCEKRKRCSSPRMRKLFSVPRCRTVACSRCRSKASACLRKALPLVVYNSRGAPNCKLMLSTYSISSSTSCSGRNSCSHPPNSVVRLYLPSENAPAPPNPRIMSQGTHPPQRVTLRSAIGQLRSARSAPASNMTTRNPSRRVKSSKAAKMPAGPPPIIATSTRSCTDAPPYYTFHRDCSISWGALQLMCAGERWGNAGEDAGDGSFWSKGRFLLLRARVCRTGRRLLALGRHYPSGIEALEALGTQLRAKRNRPQRHLIISLDGVSSFWQCTC
ncbi:MAG: hypothetical protein DDT38_00315 [Firmicutes bacterium]|nr:hypothetical protein [candidate division NPL-UPA2 bacterium]